MPINKFYIAIDRNSTEYAAHQSDFDFEVAYITEYISKNIQQYKFKYKNANKIIVYINSEKSDFHYSDVFKVLGYNSSISYEQINSKKGNERIEVILKVIEQAASALNDLVCGLSQAILDSINKLRENSFKNIWVFKKKKIAGVGQVELLCELCRDAFTLKLVINHDSIQIYKKEILRTKPSSIIYHHQFKDIQIVDNELVVLDRFNTPLFTMNLAEITA